jgi:hypothetical protein
MTWLSRGIFTVKKKLFIPRVEVKEVASLRLRPSRKVLLHKAAAAHDCTMNALLEAIIDDWLKANEWLK